MDILIGLILIGWIVLHYVAGAIARNKGRSFWGAVLISILLSPIIGIVVALVQKPNEAVVEGRRLQTGASRKCPFCAELIKKEARVCRHCGRDISPSDEKTAPAANTSDVIIDNSKEGAGDNNAYITDDDDSIKLIYDADQTAVDPTRKITVFLIGGGLGAVGLILWGVMTIDTQSDQHANVLASDRPIQRDPRAFAGMQFVTLTQSVSISGTVLPVGTRLRLVSLEGPADVRVQYAGGEYAIPISATGLK